MCVTKVCGELCDSVKWQLYWTILEDFLFPKPKPEVIGPIGARPRDTAGDISSWTGPPKTSNIAMKGIGSQAAVQKGAPIQCNQQLTHAALI